MLAYRRDDGFATLIAVRDRVADFQGSGGMGILPVMAFGADWAIDTRDACPTAHIENATLYLRNGMLRPRDFKAVRPRHKSWHSHEPTCVT